MKEQGLAVYLLLPGKIRQEGVGISIAPLDGENEIKEIYPYLQLKRRLHSIY